MTTHAKKGSVDDMRKLVISHIEAGITSGYDFIGWKARDTFAAQYPDAAAIDFEGTIKEQLAMFRAVLPNLTNEMLLSCLDEIACHAYR